MSVYKLIFEYLKDQSYMYEWRNSLKTVICTSTKEQRFPISQPPLLVCCSHLQLRSRSPTHPPIHPPHQESWQWKNLCPQWFPSSIIAINILDLTHCGRRHSWQTHPHTTETVFNASLINVNSVWWGKCNVQYQGMLEFILGIIGSQQVNLRL